MFAVADFLDLSQTAHGELFSADQPVWSAIGKIADYLKTNLTPAIHGEVSDRAIIGDNVYIGEGTVVEPNAVIKGPAWIGKNCLIRSGAYVRENVITGDNCTLGNSSEFKNCVLFNNCEVPHFNYVGDSILGYKAHLGAGVILSNVRLDRGEVIVRSGMARYATGLRKFSAIIGDHTEIGCNSVISPGTLLGKNCIVYPCTSYSGVLPSDSILKLRQSHEVVPRNLE